MLVNGTKDTSSQYGRELHLGPVKLEDLVCVLDKLVPGVAIKGTLVDASCLRV